jgi:hypothetical protein
LPPFDVPLVVQPRPGDLVLFPSWLAHAVPASGSSADRISIAFNIPGDWAETASVSARVPLQEDAPPA